MVEDDCRLTEEKMRNRRFRRAEEVILSAFLRRKRESVRHMVRGSGLARTSFYNHHRAIGNVLSDYDKYTFEKYVEMIGGMLKREKIGLRNLYFGMLRFILQEKKVFEMFLKEEKRGTLLKMVDQLRPEMIKVARISDKQERIYRICRAEILELLEEWERDGFKEDDISTLLNHMMFLTETTWERLGRGIKEKKS